MFIINRIRKLKFETKTNLFKKIIKFVIMIENLKQIENKMLLKLLSKPEIWNTLLIDYCKPVVERVWTQLGKYRLFLHFIHECKAEEVLFHTHRWPSSVHILNGSYEMGLGYNPGDVPPPKMATILFDNGGYYDMTHIDGWHYVRPIGGVCATTMLTGSVWEREETAKEFPKLGPLTEERKKVMLEWFASWYREKMKIKRFDDNKKIKRNDWVVIDESLMSAYEKRGREAYIGKMGFVIGVDGGMVDVRFGNDRMTLSSGILTLLDPDTKPSDEELKKMKESGKSVDYKSKKTLDPMDPKSWDEEVE